MKAYKTLGFATERPIYTEEIHIIRSWEISNIIKETPDNVTNTAISRETRTIFKITRKYSLFKRLFGNW